MAFPPLLCGDAAHVLPHTRCCSPKAVLSTYPLPYEGAAAAARVSTEGRLTLLCTRAGDDAFDADGMLRFRARLLSAPPCAPVPSAFWAAGFSFSRGDLVREVPYDPHLPFLFFGEETAMALRMWTRGFDIFAPDVHVLYHRWERGYRSTFWELPDGLLLKHASQQRVRRLLRGAPLGGVLLGVAGAAASCAGDDLQENGAPPPAAARGASGTAAGKEGARGGGYLRGESAPCVCATPPPAADAAVWGVGPQRTLAQYEKFAGVDLSAKRASARAECGGLVGESCFYDHYANLESMLATREAGGK